MLHQHVFIDHLGEDFSIVDIDSSNILFVGFDLTQKE
jgi:hypothetical protein